MWTFESHKDANAHYWADNDTGISKQLWCIRDNLQQINELMTPELQLRLLETQPELVFLRLNHHRKLDSKTADSGRAQRVSLLQENGFGQIDRWLNQRYGTHIKKDDLIDACACDCQPTGIHPPMNGGFEWKYRIEPHQSGG